ncbi:MAG: tRNA (adenosine(37)-N6)-threonylcarbamoyltransferase complex dimerization subunit type 1 TsaB [Thermodesulfobacteriota bacterium]|nr:tRNA (adenosine(37)-N6)-threonylcarbamoyltransferase complex dimerization subunit type 1 TsaB [Thermodesulfobacteriota bacterium]
MITLAIDTSSGTMSIALLEDDNILAELFMNSGRKHAETLLPAIKKLISSVGIKAGKEAPFSGIDLFAFTAGPGSFTGLRVGASTVKGLAFVLRKPVVGISTLDALVLNVPDLHLKDVKVCPMLDAGRGEVYTALYTPSETGIYEKTLMECVVCPDEFLGSMDGEVIFLGDGAGKYRDTIESVLPGRSFFMPPYLNHVKACAVGLLGRKKFYDGGISDIMTIVPDYLRASYAIKG